MKIALDANEANVIEKVGTGEYSYRLLQAWHKSSRHDFTLYLKHPPRKGLPPKRQGWQYQVIGPAPAWTRLALPLRLTFGRHEVFWSPAHYLPPLTSSPSVVTVHDLAYEYFPQHFLKQDLYKLKRWTKRAVKQATRVIAVSAATKADLVKLYQVAKEKITVVHNGYNSRLFNLKNKPTKQYLSDYSLIPNSYILFLGTLQPRKNVIKLIQAFRLLKEGGYQGKLVLAGKVGWLADELLGAIKSSPDSKDIVITGYVDNQTRRALYAHAEVFCLPSLYEGFGVPVLEAMGMGCPVAAAANSSLPEVVGRAGLLFNPSDPAAIAHAITTIRQDRPTWVKKGLIQAKKFSWDKCAADTLQVITKVK